MLTFQTRQKKYYREEPFIVYYKIITKGMLPIKLNLYVMANFWETCLPGNEHYAKIPLFSSQETSWPGPPVND